jgi:glycosyltransferase involved in cell wall biosynthesis
MLWARLSPAKGKVKRAQGRDIFCPSGIDGDKRVTFCSRLAELFALPSVFQTFAIIALEAMACGKLVVASKFEGITMSSPMVDE